MSESSSLTVLNHTHVLSRGSGAGLSANFSRDVWLGQYAGFGTLSRKVVSRTRRRGDFPENTAQPYIPASSSGGKNCREKYDIVLSMKPADDSELREKRREAWLPPDELWDGKTWVLTRGIDFSSDTTVRGARITLQWAAKRRDGRIVAREQGDQLTCRFEPGRRKVRWSVPPWTKQEQATPFDFVTLSVRTNSSGPDGGNGSRSSVEIFVSDGGGIIGVSVNDGEPPVTFDNLKIELQGDGEVRAFIQAFEFAAELLRSYGNWGC